MIPRRLRLKRARGNDYVVRLAQLRHDIAAMKQGVGSTVADALMRVTASDYSGGFQFPTVKRSGR